jgi:signal transduction histidine kinase
MTTPTTESSIPRGSAPVPGARLRWLAIARLIVLAGGLVLSLIVAVAGGAWVSSTLALAPLVITLATLAVLSLAVLAYLGPANGKDPSRKVTAAARQRLTALLVYADVVGLTLVIHFAGGAENPFYPLYAFPIIVAAVLLGRVAALAAAALATGLYSAVVIAEWAALLPHHHVLPASLGLAETGLYVLAQCTAVGVTCFLAAVGTSALVGMLHTRTRDLEENQARVEERAAEMRSLNEQLQAANHELQHNRAHLDAAYAELQTAYDRLQIRSSHMSELNEQLRVANAECKARREELAQVNARLREALERLETRSSHMGELNDLLRAANAECSARRHELERLNDELALANRKLRELEDVRAQFTLLTTHELRAPVAAIQSYLKLILEGYVPQNKVRETLEKAERRAMEQLALIADLLELGRIGSADARGLVQPVRVEQSLCEQVELLMGSAKVRGITVETHIGPDLPPVLANPDQIRSLWNNLVSNAIKYNRDGGNVTVTLIREGERLIASVADTGIGIPKEAMTRLFSEFFRADNAKSVSRMGTGLGLSIVKEIVERAGGQITVESELDKGTTFHLWLPVYQAA